jgi:hypothetical protein
MTRLKVREVELLNEYLAADPDSEPTPPMDDEQRAEADRRREAREALQAELDAEG